MAETEVSPEQTLARDSCPYFGGWAWKKPFAEVPKHVIFIFVMDNLYGPGAYISGSDVLNQIECYAHRWGIRCNSIHEFATLVDGKQLLLRTHGTSSLTLNREEIDRLKSEYVTPCRG